MTDQKMHFLKTLPTQILIATLLCYGANAQKAGDLDPAFGVNGITKSALSNNCNSRSIALFPDNRILVGGRNYNGSSHDFMLAKYLPNGDLDRTFGINGIATADFYGGDDFLYK